jgi:hypothetical protein
MLGDPINPRAAFLEASARLRHALRVGRAIALAPLVLPLLHFMRRRERSRRLGPFGVPEAEEHRTFRRGAIVDSDEKPFRPLEGDQAKAVDNAFEQVRRDARLNGLSYVGVALLFLRRRVLRQKGVTLLSNAFFVQKMEDFRRTASSNFWMRVAQLDDRSLVLVATGKLDEFLAVCIVTKCRLLADKRMFERVFEGEGPLSRFAHKISVAHLLGLLVGDMLHDITIMRKIRNEFAHDYTFKDFGTKEISSRCKSLKLHIDLSDEILNLAGTAERKAFITSAAMMSLHLAVILQYSMSEFHIIQKYRDEMNAHAHEAVEVMKKGAIGSVEASVPQVPS